MPQSAELVLDVRAALGEGALWDATLQRLLWVNILDEELHIFDPSCGDDRIINVGQTIGTVVPRAAGGVVFAGRYSFVCLDLDTETMTPIAKPVSDPDHRFNDGKCDPAGRFWAGACHMNCSDPVGKLYCLRPDGSVHAMLDSLNCPNGIAWSADQATMYYIDTGKQEIWAFDYDVDNGTIANQRTIAVVSDEQGFPDGMTIDAAGNLWVAHWGGYCVRCWDPKTGSVVETISVPAKQVTSCAFGGPNLDELYITSARRGLDDTELATNPSNGSLFMCRPGVTGVSANTYSG